MGSIGDHATEALPKTQRAVVVDAGDHVRIREDTPIPTFGDHEFLVRTDAWAINPSDTKMRGDFVSPGAMLGCDFAGTVIARGSKATQVEVGDRVCGVQHEMNAKDPFHGAFGMYNVPTGPFWLKLPKSLSTEGGATMSAAVGTAGLALKLLGLPLPDTIVEKSMHILVYGGGTATATIAIQLLKSVNMIPITACSPVHNDRLRSYGVEQAFDYHVPECAYQIKAYTKNNLRYALDCITTVESTKFCFAAIGRAGGKYVALDPFPPHAATRKAVKTDWTLGPLLYGVGCVWPAPYGQPPDPELLTYGTKVFARAQRMLDEGRLHNHPVKVIKGGLEQVMGGMDMVREGKLRGEKCVVSLGA